MLLRIKRTIAYLILLLIFANILIGCNKEAANKAANIKNIGLNGDKSLNTHGGKYKIMPQQVETYSIVEISFDNTYKLDNPYDTRQIDVQGIFLSPTGKEWKIPGFYYEDFEKTESRIIAKDKAQWKIRFAPVEPGQWSVKVNITTKDAEVTQDVGMFDVKEKDARGFLRVSKKNPVALEFENGDPLFVIGANVFPFGDYRTEPGLPIHPERGQQVVNYIERTANAGGTFGRLRMDSIFIPIEGIPDVVTGYEGIGRYHQLSAWEIDQIVQAAQKKGVTLMLCMENPNCNINFPVMKNITPLKAKSNIYDQSNGGPLKDMNKFWTDPETQRLVKQKIRYIIARWGANTSVGCWELFNEINIASADSSDVIVQWYKEIAEYIHQIDPYRRPISSSYHGGAINQYKEKWWQQWESLDIIQYHTYKSKDVAKDIGDINAELLKKSNKPYIVGEFGTADEFRKVWNIGDAIIDPDGVHLHNGIWSSAFTGSVGAMPWFVWNYIDPLNLYPIYTGLSRFVADWKINEGAWKPVTANSFTSKGEVPYRIYALGYNDEIRFWIQNKNNTYMNHYEGKKPKTGHEAVVYLSVEKTGNYEVQWWDTYKGEVVNTIQLEAKTKQLEIPFSGTTSDMACKVKLIRVPKMIIKNVFDTTIKCGGPK